MIEQLLDQLHLYPLSGFLRIVKKALTTRERSQRDWIGRYGIELTISESILHCKANTEEEKKIYLLNRGTVVEEKNKSELDPELEKYDTRISKLRQAFWDHQRILVTVLMQKPCGPWIREYDLKGRRKQQGMPRIWWEEGKICALRGGCCSRTCRCCEKPLRTCMEPNPRSSDRKKDIKHIYGHCTRECRCCIQSKGFKMTEQCFVDFMNKHYGGI
jgi:hypothetical protein